MVDLHLNRCYERVIVTLNLYRECLVTKFVSIAELQSEHKVQLGELQAEIDSLKSQLVQQGEVIKQQTLMDSANHYQELQGKALAEQKEQLQLEFNQQVMALVDEEIINRTHILQSNIKSIETAYTDLMESVYEHCTQVALLILQKITSHDSSIKLDIIKRSLLDSINNQQLSDEQLTIHLNPNDASKLKAIWQDKNVIIKTTDALKSGDVKISSDAGVLSGLFEERIIQIMESISDDKTQYSEPSV